MGCQQNHTPHERYRCLEAPGTSMGTTINNVIANKDLISHTPKTKEQNLSRLNPAESSIMNNAKYIPHTSYHLIYYHECMEEKILPPL
jgi:hypothetical protein